MHSSTSVYIKCTYIPSLSPIPRFSHIVIPLSMPAHIQHFVLHVRHGLRIQRAHLALEALPLRFSCSVVRLRVSVVRAVDKAEVRRYLVCSLRNKPTRKEERGAIYVVELLRIGALFVLQEISFDGGVPQVRGWNCMCNRCRFGHFYYQFCQ